MRILLVDDHPVVRLGVGQILRNAFASATIGEAADASQALAELRSAPWEIVLLDLSMPGTGGLELLKDLRREKPRVPILVLSMHPAEQFAARALRAGAVGYVTKDAAPTELATAVQRILSGDPPYVSGGEPPSRRPNAPRRLHDALSDREYQVLRMMGRGRTVSQIAADLALSVKTISTYRARLLEKMNMANTAELMRYAIEHGLVD
jgi:two-component system, NarL family, invasion response regulator UvrY